MSAYQPTEFWVPPRDQARSKWSGMLHRAGPKQRIDKYPTYKDCSAAETWLVFDSFKFWFEQQPLAGTICDLDKDLLVPGNRVYGPETCLLVTKGINHLFAEISRVRGLPMGVTISHHRSHRFEGNCSPFSGPRKRFLGTFPTPQLAHQAWQRAKIVAVQQAIETQTDPRVVKALQLRIDWLLQDLAEGKETVSLNMGR